MEATTLLRIGVEQIDTSGNPRMEYGDIDALAGSFGDSEAPVEPIVVQRKYPHNGSTPFEIVSGARRLTALIQQGATDVLAVVAPTVTETELRLARLKANSQRLPLNAMEEARAYHDLVKSGVPQAQIASKMGLSAALVSMRLGLLELHPRVQDAVAENSISVSVAEELGRLSDDAQGQAMTTLRSLPRSFRTVSRAKGLVGELLDPEKSEGFESDLDTATDLEEMIRDAAPHPADDKYDKLLEAHEHPLQVLVLSDLSNVAQELAELLDFSFASLSETMRRLMLDEVAGIVSLTDVIKIRLEDETDGAEETEETV